MEAPAELQLEAVNESVGRARRFVADALGASTSAAARENVLLVVSELVTNAVIHAGTTLRVRVRAGEDRIRLEVEDGSAKAPRRKHYGVESGTGRGMALVDAVARAWGWTPTDGGKIVWAEVGRSGAS